jgi:hypothetical protein
MSNIVSTPAPASRKGRLSLVVELVVDSKGLRASPFRAPRPFRGNSLVSFSPWLDSEKVSSSGFGCSFCRCREVRTVCELEAVAVVVSGRRGGADTTAVAVVLPVTNMEAVFGLPGSFGGVMAMSLRPSAMLAFTRLDGSS